MHVIGMSGKGLLAAVTKSNSAHPISSPLSLLSSPPTHPSPPPSSTPPTLQAPP